MSGLRERQRELRRTAILDAVRQLLRTDGEQPLTTERIAARATVSHQTVYNLVGTRAQVWAALMKDFVAALDRRLVARSTFDPVARLHQIATETAELFIADPVVSRRLVRAWEDSGQALEHGPGHHVRDALRDAQAAGVLLSDVDAGALAAQLSISCLGALHLWAAGMIDDERFRRDVACSAAVVLAAAARPEHRARLIAELIDHAASARAGAAR